MKNYRDALSRFLATDFGGGADQRTEDPDATLRQDIHAVIQADTKYFNLCVGILVLLFVLAIALVFLNLRHPANVTAIFSVTGLSFAFLLKQMTGLWREKSHAEVAYSLAVRLPPQDLKAVISVLLAGEK
jgi:cytochrome c biogenesis factor